MKKISDYRGDILKIFSNIISEYLLDYNLIADNKIILENKHGKLEFYMDFDVICCDLILSYYKKPIPLNWIPIYGFEKPDFERGGKNKDFYKNEIEVLEDIVTKYLHETFLRGNSYWLKNYDENEFLSIKKMELVRALPNDNLIKLKFLTGDMSWLIDIETLL